MTLGIGGPFGLGGGTLTGSSAAFNASPPNRASLGVAPPASPQAQGAGRAAVQAGQAAPALVTFRFPDGHTEQIQDTPAAIANAKRRGGARVANVITHARDGGQRGLLADVQSDPTRSVAGQKITTLVMPDGTTRTFDVSDHAGIKAAVDAGGRLPTGRELASTELALTGNQGGAFDASPENVNATIGGGIPNTNPSSPATAISGLVSSIQNFLTPGRAAGPTPVNLGGAGGAGGVGGVAAGLGGGPGGGVTGGLPGSGGVVADRIGRRTLAGTGLLGAFGQGLVQQDQIRGGQLQSLADLQAAARGEVPSAAELQSRRDIQRAIAGQFAQAASARGGAGAQALAQRAAQSQAAQLTADQAGRAAILRAQETDQARRTLADALGQARAQDFQAADLGLQSATTQLGADLDAARADQAASLQAQQANLDARLKELGINADLLTTQQRNQLAAALQTQQLQTQVELANAGLLRGDRDALLGGLGDLFGLLGLGGNSA